MPSQKPGYLSWQCDGSLTLHCQLQPNAAKNEIVGEQGGRLKIRITAPPVDGKANTALIQFLSKTFGVPKSHIAINKGHASRQKTVTIIEPKQLPPSVPTPSKV